MGKGQGKTALYKEGFSLENFSEENYKKDFKFLGEGFGENPLFKEGSPRVFIVGKSYVFIGRVYGEKAYRSRRKGSEKPPAQMRQARKLLDKRADIVV